MVIELRVVQFWSEIILVISNPPLKSRAYDFRPNCTPLSSITIINNLFKSPKNDQYQISPCHNRYRTQSLRLRRYALYGVRGVSQIKFTMSDSFLVFYDFDILSMIKRRNPFGFYCVILILNLSRLISSIAILISKI